MSERTKLVILYGGETGNCEDLAKRITWQAELKNVHVTAGPIDHGTFDKLSKLRLENVDDVRILFICSTTGQGDVPRPMVPFWKNIMKKSLEFDTFGHLNGYIIGLGDSSYLKYNFVAKKLTKRLKLLGFNQLLETAFGDDQHDHGLDAGIEPFMNELWASIQPVDNGHVQDVYTNGDMHMDDRLPRPTIRFESQEMKNCWTPIGLIPKSEFLTTTIIKNDRVTEKDHFQDTRLIRIEVIDGLNNDVGDVIAIEPVNDGQEVEEFIELINLDPDADIYPNLVNKLNVISHSKYQFLPPKIKLRTFVSNYLDIHSTPKRSFFELIWKLSPKDSIERTKLKELSSKEGLEDYFNYVTRPKRTILEVLRDFPNTARNLPLNYVPDLIPAIKAREFSIASCPNFDAKDGQNDGRQFIEILVAVVNYRTRLRTPRIGLCSNYLSNLSPGDKVSVAIRKGTIKVPPKDDPVILIGPGTGVAPLRAIIQSRLNSSARSYLFFGCRNESKDFYFKNEFKKYQKDGHLDIFPAFSRQFEDKIVYVQHLLINEKQLVKKSITEDNASVIICGSSKQMPENVRDAIIEVLNDGENQLKDGDNQAKDEAEKFVTILESKKRIQYECWS